jgi:hypothetical protein
MQSLCWGEAAIEAIDGVKDVAQARQGITKPFPLIFIDLHLCAH